MVFSDEYFMSLALKKARQGIGEGQAPFGAAIVKDNALLSCEHNHVRTRLDVTAHAEMLAIREAAKKLKGLSLAGCTLYATCEPCDMCFGAAAWAGISRVVFSVGRDQAEAAGLGDHRLTQEYLTKLKGQGMVIQGRVSLEEGKVLLEQYQELQGESMT